MLEKFDNKLVRLVEIDNEVFEGYAVYFDKECSEVMYGGKEECIKIETFLFYKSIIKEIKEIKEFSAPYGTLERLTVEDGLDMIDEALSSEDDCHIARLLTCIIDCVDTLDYKKDLIPLMERLLKYNKDSVVLEKAAKLVEIINR